MTYEKKMAFLFRQYEILDSIQFFMIWMLTTSGGIFRELAPVVPPSASLRAHVERSKVESGKVDSETWHVLRGNVERPLCRPPLRSGLTWNVAK